MKNKETIHSECPNCFKRWTATELKEQWCRGCGYPTPEDETDFTTGDDEDEEDWGIEGIDWED